MFYLIDCTISSIRQSTHSRATIPLRLSTPLIFKFTKTVSAHKPALVYISSYAINVSLSGILPQYIVFIVSQYRLIGRILGNHQFITIQQSDKIFVIEVGTGIYKRLLMIGFFNHIKKLSHRIAESFRTHALLYLNINHRNQVLLTWATLCLEVLQLL